MSRISLALVAASLMLSGSHATAQPTAKVSVTIVVPKKTPSFSNHRLVVLLTHDFPNQDDRGDKTVDRYLESKFSHEKGKDTIVTFVLGEKAKVNLDVQYHITASIFDKASKCTHIGTVDGEPGPFTVISNEAPRKLRITIAKAP